MLSPAIIRFLKDQGLWGPEACTCQGLRGDGSGRPFFRLLAHGRPPVVLVLPDPDQPRGLAEAAASLAIGRHLAAAGVPVPRILAAEPPAGWIVFQDLGDRHLATAVAQASSRDQVLGWYRSAVEILLALQIDGWAGFDPAWSWDTPLFDRDLMRRREADYFLERFWQGYLGQPTVPDGVAGELDRLADRASEASTDFLVHRDFQSRNLMLTPEGALAVIDFQGARQGPRAYDLASLLLDPYVELPVAEQEELLDFYGLRAAARGRPVPPDFRVELSHLALQRNLQILGAFGFLVKVRGKGFFKASIPGAVRSLNRLLTWPELSAFPRLRGLAEEIPALLASAGTHPEGELP
ncbi:MAG: phosphotransferase [Thermodesulfobacteriota bacterium]